MLVTTYFLCKYNDLMPNLFIYSFIYLSGAGHVARGGRLEADPVQDGHRHHVTHHGQRHAVRATLLLPGLLELPRRGCRCRGADRDAEG